MFTLAPVAVSCLFYAAWKVWNRKQPDVELNIGDQSPDTKNFYRAQAALPTVAALSLATLIFFLLEHAVGHLKHNVVWSIGHFLAIVLEIVVFVLIGLAVSVQITGRPKFLVPPNLRDFV